MIRGLLLFTVFLSTPVFAVDLLDLYRLARENDTHTAAARAHYRAVQERVPQARAGLLPQSGVGVQWTPRGDGAGDDLTRVIGGRFHPDRLQ